MKFAIPDAVLEATRLTKAGRLADATVLLRRMLAGHEPEPAHSPPTIDGIAEPPAPSWAAPRASEGSQADATHQTSRRLSGLLHRLLGGDVQPPANEGVRPTPAPRPAPFPTPSPSPRSSPSPEPSPEPERSREPEASPAPYPSPASEPSPVSTQSPSWAPGKQFLTASFTNPAGTRPYKLYVPSGYRDGVPVPLIVMLHGCTQSPDDFAAGTRMNGAGEAHTCLVAWPAQIKAANMGKCWNWFNETDQRRDSGEPSLIAGITRQVMRDYSVDPRRVYVAGLSAGGAAAAIMGAAYPDLYAAIGVHSGLACGAAHDMASALAAMKRGGHGAPQETGHGRGGVTRRAVPAIVFHGGGDTTVNPRNGDAVVSQLASAEAPWRRVEEGQVPGGHAWRRTSHVDAGGRSLIEYWQIRGAGHAWSGGSPAGSFTDPRGPDATGEMVRFFLEHPQADGAL